MKPEAEIHLVGTCLDCRVKHEIASTPAAWLSRISDWREKHLGHRIEFRSPKRKLPRGLDDSAFERAGRAPWWLNFRANADIKWAYAQSADYTITLASLASSSTLTAGRESASVSNSSNLYLDYIVGGKVTTGTSPTASKTIRVVAIGAVNDTPLWPDVFGGTDTARTVTNSDVLSGLPILGEMATASSSSISYPLTDRALSSAFNGLVPKLHSLFVVHDTGVALHATGSNHVLSYTGVYMTAI